MMAYRWFVHLICKQHAQHTRIALAQITEQMIVIAKQGEPLTLVAHSQDGQTHFELVDTPQQRPQRVLKSAVLQALALAGFATIRYSNSTNAP
jgi:hypothetical protein